MKSRSTLRSFLLGASISLLALSSAPGQTTYTWDISGTGVVTGGTGAWNTSNTLWTTDVGVTNTSWVNAAGTPKNNAVFGGTAGTVTLGEAISIQNMTFSNTTGIYSVTGQTLNFTSGTIFMSSNGGSSSASVATSSNISGAPTINTTITGSAARRYDFTVPANGSMVLGNIVSAVHSSADHVSTINLGGGSNSTGELGSSLPTSGTGVGNRLYFNSGTWTLKGAAYSRDQLINGATVTVASGGQLRSSTREVALTSGTLNYNNAGAVDHDNSNFDSGRIFRIAGGTINNTSGAAITTSTSNPDMVWAANWTFSGTNGANSNLFLGTGRVSLNGGSRQVTVTNAATTLTIGGVISNAALVGTTTGTGALTKAGAGTLELRGINAYTGATAVNAGTLAITGTGSINTSSGISVAAGGTFRYNSSTALTKAPALAGAGTSNRAVLGGTGPINASVTLDNLGDVLSPGNSPGIQSYTVGQSWASFSYDWEVNDFSDVTGLTAGSDFDQIAITGSLNLSGGSGSYILNVLGLTALNAAGLVPNFSEINRSWTILTTTTGITNFNDANWTVNTAGFTDPDTGTWALAKDGNNLVLSYTVVPEPRAALLGGIGMLMLLRRRR